MLSSASMLLRETAAAQSGRDASHPVSRQWVEIRVEEEMCL